ncbi:MAG: type II secretion system protein [Pseudomonadota bacterium]
MSRPALRQRGVSLVELAVGLLVLSLVIGGLLIPLATQVEQNRLNQAQRQLEEVRESLVGFALANGRLPCPASPTSGGVESPPGGGVCTHPNTGFVPAVTLGLSTIDEQGYAIDPWGLAQNRIRYAVTASNGSAFTTGGAGSMRVVGLSALAPALRVCSTGAGATATDCASGTTLASNAVAVIWSLGPNAATGGTSVDEAQNPNPNSANADAVFVSRVRGSTAVAEFDDLVTWLSPNVLYARLVAAGQLP